MTIPLLSKVTINEMKPIAPGHPVYKVAYSFQSKTGKMVLKGELASSGKTDKRYSIDYIAHLFTKTTQGFAEMRLLGADETPIMRNRLPENDPMKNQQVFNSQIYYAMSMLDNLFDLNKPVSEPGFKKVLSYVNNKPVCMRSLGEIIAVDLFIGNFDRFDKRNQAWVINNPGNIFLTYSDSEGARFLGIDFFDPNSRFAYMFENISTCEQDMNEPWAARDTLRDSNGKARDKIAKDVGNALGGREGFSLNNKHFKELREGFGRGRKTLKKTIQEDVKNRYYASGKMTPKGIISRKTALGW